MPKRESPLTHSEDVQRVLAERKAAGLDKPPEPRSKATYDLPQSMIAAVNEIAKVEKVTRSDVVAWALAELLAEYRAGRVDWTEHREPAVRNPRAVWKLTIRDF